jgi:acetyl-CoA carboxylase carboxyl transferase subunit beta
VIEQTIRQKLPADFQTAEFLLEHGMVDMVTPRAELRNALQRLLGLYAPASRDSVQQSYAALQVEV